ncbi:MAG: T9SS type A sorting domain-containing protein [Bacteroidia bacterium]|nr:T9SS type A sorting domain-containing protein [Bacteroidia bacterium]
MKKIITSFIFIASVAVMHAQPIIRNWINPISTLAGGNMISKKVKQNSNGDLFVAGYFQGSIDLDPGVGTATFTTNGAYDVFVASYNSAGAFLGGYTFGGTGDDFVRDMDVDNSSNIYLTGEFTGSMNLGTTGSITSAGLKDVFVINLQYSSNSISPTWIKSFGGTGNDVGYALAKANHVLSQAVWVTGSFSGTVDFDPSVATSTLTSAGGTDIFLTRLDLSGNYISTNKYGNTYNDNAYAIAATPAEVYITGGVIGTTVFGSIAMAGSGNGTIIETAYIAKISTANATPMWVRSFYSIAGAARGVGIAVNPTNGDVYTVGSFDNTGMDFDPGGGYDNLSSAGGTDGFISKLNVFGNHQWARRFGGVNNDGASSIALDTITGVSYVFGEFTGSITFSPLAPASSSLTSVGTSNDMVLAKYTNSGAFSFSGKIGTSNTADIASSVSVSNSGSIYLAGSTPGTNVASAGYFNFSNTPSGPIAYWQFAHTSFVAKYSDCSATTVTVAVSTQTFCPGNEISFTASNNFSTYAWSGPSSYTSSVQNPTISVSTASMAGNYTLTATAVNGCSVISTISLTAISVSSPAFTGPASISICSGNTASLSASSPGPISWFASPTGTTALTTGTVYTTPTLTSNTSYYISTTSNGCESTRAVKTVTVKPTPNAPVIVSGDLVICQGSSTIIMLDVISSIYTVQTGGSPVYAMVGGVNVNASSPTYYADVTVNGCSSFPRTVITVTVNPLPSVLSQTVSKTCSGSSNGSIALTLNNPSSYSYTWSPNVSTTYSATSLAAGVYTVQIDNMGCVNTQTYNVTQHPIYNVPVNIVGGNILNFNDGYVGGTTFQWLDCNNGNAPISGAVNAQFTPTVSGSYALVVTDVCASTSTCTSILITGISENSLLNNITLQPNPASTYFTLGNVAEGTSVNVIDVTGKVVISNSVIATDKTMTIETSNLSNGIYVIQLKNNGAVAQKKLVISN